jgi:hypothetical protein
MPILVLPMTDFVQQNYPKCLTPFAVPDLLRDLDYHSQEAPGQDRGGEERHVG